MPCEAATNTRAVAHYQYLKEAATSTLRSLQLMHVLLRQANIRIMEVVAQRLGISMDKVIP